MSSVYQIIFHLFLLFTLIQRIYAQNESLHFEHLGVKDGLSNENVTTMMQDSKGSNPVNISCAIISFTKVINVS
jgi:hypothetical protein